MLQKFSDVEMQAQASLGGKGGALARLYKAGFPVPDGFVILPSAFEDDLLRAEAWAQVQAELKAMRQTNPETAFAVRSSAIAEDSAYASFAGEFETVLDVHTDEAVRAAIGQVRLSRKSERVQAYSRAKGLDEEQEIAVVIQKLVRAEISGILFTADPVTGSRFKMTGNYIFGLGEGLVSGEVEPYTFILARPKGSYEGPDDLKRFAKQLYKLGRKLEEELGCPQDVEWAIAEGKLYLLQSRPITTLLETNPMTGEMNSSFTGDYLWIGNEVFPYVLTPSSRSVFNHFHNFNIEGVPTTGSIGGRFYMNFSLAYMMMKAFGWSDEKMYKHIELTTGFSLREVTLPEIPLSRWMVIKNMLPIQRELLPKQAKLMKRFDEIIAGAPGRSQELRQAIKNTQDKAGLAALWHEEVFPFFFDLLMIQDKANEDYFFPYSAARKILVKLMGEKEADALLVNLVGGSGDLTSIRPVLDLPKLARGEMSREEYATLAGHRLPHEDELSFPRPYEEPDWIEQRLAEHQASPTDYETMLAQRGEKIKEAWQAFAGKYPKQADKVKEKIEKITANMEKREIIRSELTRSLGVIRDWFLQAGALTGLGEDIFLLEDEEALSVLAGEPADTEMIAKRRKTYEKQIELPRIPMVISGRFDPKAWAKDPNRRSDMFDAHMPLAVRKDADSVNGHPGSGGQAEGLVRIIYSPDEGADFQPGEVLVAPSTNVGWTPLFPRAAAVVTDVGAPLSHAAIVARELGIPAVVGTGNGTFLLQTGDRVRVDGGQGVVQVLEKAAS